MREKGIGEVGRERKEEKRGREHRRDKKDEGIKNRKI